MLFSFLFHFILFTNHSEINLKIMSTVSRKILNAHNLQQKYKSSLNKWPKNLVRRLLKLKAQYKS